jgi:hypothetical protein
VESAEETVSLSKKAPDFDMATSREGYPFPVTLHRARIRVDGRALDCVEDSASQRPTTHRLLRRCREN